jgi:3-deoxy-D-manno-octulosonate 8-phosphate phosphatase (KDO 8-P phosphatase)
MKAVPAKLRRRLAKVRCLLMDVDGVLTDGGLHYTSEGHEFKTFNVLDGHGIAMAKRAGILVGFISARPSQATVKRAQDLGVAIVKIAPVSKAELLAEIQREHNLAVEEIAFVGDDLVDLPVLQRVGFAATVPNGVAEAKAVAHYTTQRRGGEGAVREIVEMLLKARGSWAEAVAKYTALFCLCASAVIAIEGTGYIEKFEVPERDAQGNLLWKITGDKAQLGTNGLMTIVNARAEYYASNKVAGVFSTPFCVLDRANSRAVTDSPIRIERDNMIVTGVGGVWDGKQSVVTINSNVQVVLPGALMQQENKP